MHNKLHLLEELEMDWRNYYRKDFHSNFYYLSSFQYTKTSKSPLDYCGKILPLSYKISADIINESLFTSFIDLVYDFFKGKRYPQSIDNTLSLTIRNNKKVANCLYTWKNRKTIKTILLSDGRLLDHCEIISLRTANKITYVSIKYKRTYYMNFATWLGVAKFHKTSNNLYVTESLY